MNIEKSLLLLARSGKSRSRHFLNAAKRVDENVFTDPSTQIAMLEERVGHIPATETRDFNGNETREVGTMRGSKVLRLTRFPKSLAVESSSPLVPE